MLCAFFFFFLLNFRCLFKEQEYLKTTKQNKNIQAHGYPALLQQITEHLQMALTPWGRWLGVCSIVTEHV